MGYKIGHQPKISDVSYQYENKSAVKRNLLLKKKLQSANYKIRRLEEEKNGNLLNSIMDTGLVEIAVLTAVRDAEYNIADFNIRIVNKKLEAVTGRHDLLGKNYFKEFPSLIAPGVFEAMVDVVTAGQSLNMDYPWLCQEKERWFRGTFVKLGDGLVVTTLDITDSKEAESVRSRDLALQSQSEEMAVIGSWEYDLQTGKLTWSPGMYRIFKIQEKTPISPDIYIKLSSAESRVTAERLVKNILSGSGIKEELLSIIIGSNVRMIQVNTELRYDDEGNPIRIFGVDRDISTEVNLQLAKWELEQKQRDLETAQGQLLFKAALSSQEDERIRIAESLHNGVGQLLFGIKLSIERLNVETLKENGQEFEELRKSTGQLLEQTIQEVRNLSHELSPAILEQFGLKLGIANICNQYRKQIDFGCFFKGSETFLDKYIRITVYRTVQELALNIFKHSGAANALIKVYIEKSEVTIMVSDDGIGQMGSKSRTGIGLATIENKIALLNGSTKFNFNLDGKNTTKIVIPFVAA